jgi:CHASE2 domain-containing sensor protein
LDLIVQDGLQVAILGERPSTVTAVLAVPPEADLHALRPGWAAVVEALAAAGARAVVFDLVFSAALPGDAALAEALSSAPIPVVLAARGGDGPLRGPATEALAALPLGLVEVEHDLLLRRVRQGPVSRPDAAGAPVWNLAVAGLAAAEGGPPPRREADTLILGLRRVPIVGGRLRLAPTAAPLRVPLGGPLEAVAGRIVVVGAVDRVGDQHATAAGPRQGVEVIANFIDTLAAGAGLRPLPLLAELGLVAAALSAQLGLGRAGGRAATRSAGLLGLALLGLTALLLAAGQAFGPSAGLVGLGLCAWAQRAGAQRAGAATGPAGTGRA